MYTHKFESEESLFAVYNWSRWDGRKFHVNIYMDGFVEVKEFSSITYQTWKE